MADAIESVLERHDFRAGRFSVGYSSCDDSTAQWGNFDLRICAANANAYRARAQLVAVIGTYNSDCAADRDPDPEPRARRAARHDQPCEHRLRA